MTPKRKGSRPETGLLKTAAEAIGTTLGKLALKTGFAVPVNGIVKRTEARSPKKKRPASKTSDSRTSTQGARTAKRVRKAGSRIRSAK